MEKENLKIIITVGIPASGKSTWSKDYVLRNSEWARVNRDDFRSMLKNSGTCEPKVEAMINELEYGAIEHALHKKMNVIVDNTNLRAKYINAIVKRFKYSADIEFRIFDISLSKAMERNKMRSNVVNDADMERMYGEYKILIDSFVFQPIKKIARRPNITPVFETSLPNAVIFDVDQTIALVTNRGPFDWDKVHRDDLNPIVSEHIEFHRSLDRKIIIVSGRDGAALKGTADWLDLYGLHYDELLMRPEEDYRKDHVVKREIYEQHIKGKYNVLCVYDDRLQVLEMWNKLGIFTFNVNQGQNLY
jgi:predicted kinase